MRAEVEANEAGGTGHALRESEQQFRLLVQGVTDYAIYMLDLDGRVSNWNAGGERIKGYLAEEIVGRHFSCFYTPEDCARGEPVRALASARDAGKYETEGWRLRKDGTRFWASVVIDPVHDDDGRLIGYAKITRDVSERRAAEEALDAARQNLMQAQKAQAVGQLTFGVAHDFNNLLTVITNSLDLIAVDSSDPQRVRRLVAGAHRAAERGALLTRQLLAFSRRQTLNPVPGDINAMIYGMEAMLRRAVGETIEFELDLAPRMSLSEIDVGEFEAAMLNLVVNARDAMAGGGRITIRTREREIDDPAELGGDVLPGRFVCVCVEDTGEGMSAAVRERATEPFFTTKDVGKGSGLGLSQVDGFVAQSGGHVSLHSAEGQGTKVCFSLPVSTRAGELGASPARAPTKVLFTEDDPDLQGVALEALRYMGYAVLVANEGEAALEILRRDPEIDILFTDVVMPKGMNGVELAGHARALRPDLKVLLASGYARSQLPDIPEGCDFIAKPYRIDDLELHLRRLESPSPSSA